MSTGSGDITIKTGSSNQVVVHGTIHDNDWFFSNENAVHQVESNPPIQQSGNSIRIGYNLPDDVKRHVAIDYEITVPASTAVEAHSGSGNVEVTGVSSGVQAQTGSGDIRLRDLGGRQQAHTGSGNIRAENVSAPFNAETGSGDIEASLTGAGDVDVHTGSGRIQVKGVKGGVHARTGSGDIEADGSVAGPWQLHSGSGNIRLAVGSNGGFNARSAYQFRIDSFGAADYGARLHGQPRTQRHGRRRRPDGRGVHQLRGCGDKVVQWPVVRWSVGSRLGAALASLLAEAREVRQGLPLPSVALDSHHGRDYFANTWLRAVSSPSPLISA